MQSEGNTNRLEFAKGKNKPRGIVYSEFSNTTHVKYVEIMSSKEEMVCQYVELLYIEKSRGFFDPPDSEYREWRPDPRWKATACFPCFKIMDNDPPGQTVIKVDNSRDMLPLYMKWALRLGGAKVDEEGWFDNETYGEDGLKLHDTLSRLYENINGKHRLRKFSEHKCEKCKSEWIVFDEKREEVKEQ